MGRVRISRVLIAAVLVMNVQCALQFLANAEAYLAAYELEGVPGGGCDPGARRAVPDVERPIPGRVLGPARAPPLAVRGGRDASRSGWRAKP